MERRGEGGKGREGEREKERGREGERGRERESEREGERGRERERERERGRGGERGEGGMSKGGLHSTTAPLIDICNSSPQYSHLTPPTTPPPNLNPH